MRLAAFPYVLHLEQLRRLARVRYDLFTTCFRHVSYGEPAIVDSFFPPVQPRFLNVGNTSSMGVHLNRTDS